MGLKAITALMLLLMPILAYASPAIDFPELKHVFGQVGQGKAEHFFEFFNRGDQDLIIEKVSAS
jgi:hypothetical protein